MIKHRCMVSFLAAVVLAISGAAGSGRDSPAVGQLKSWDLPIADLPGKYSGEVNHVGVESTGVTWIATSEGAVRFDPIAQSWRIFTVADGLAANEVAHVFIARDGRVILATWGKGISVRDPGSNVFQTIRTADDNFISADSVVEDSAGNIWFSGFGSNFYRLAPKGDRLEPQRQKGPTNEGVLRNELIILEADHRLWAVGTFDRTGLLYFDAIGENWSFADMTSVSKVLASGPTADADAAKSEKPSIRDIATDGKKLWLIANGQLVEFDPVSQQARLVSDIDGQTIGSATALAGDDRGRVWAVLTDSLYYRDRETGAWHNTVKIKNNYVRLFSDAAGGFWVVGENTLLRVDSNGAVLDTLPTMPVRRTNKYPRFGLGRHPDSIAFYSDPAAVYRFDLAQSRWQLLASYTDDLAGNNVRQAVTDADGRLWATVVTSKGSLSRHYSWQRLDLESGLWAKLSTNVIESRLDTENSRVSTWILERDFLRRAPRFSGYRPHEPEWRLPDQITAISDLGTGILWAADSDAIQKCLWANRTCVPTKVSELARIAPVGAILDSGNTEIWLGGKGGIIRYDTVSGVETFVPIDRPTDEPSPSGKLKGSADDLVVSAMFLSSSKLLRIGTNYGLFQLDLAAPVLTAKRDNVAGRIEKMRRDGSGNLWVQVNGGLVRAAAGSDDFRPIPIKSQRSQSTSSFFDEQTPLTTLPDAQGGIWFATERGLSRQGWSEKGFPGRAIDISFLGDRRNFARVTTLDNGELAVWQTRPTGLVLRTAHRAAAFPNSISYPTTALEPAHKGAVWVGHALGGLSIQLPNGSARRVSIAEGLPDSNVLSISPIPKGEDRVWVATNDGAALVSADDVDRPVRVISRPLPGPVDVVRALPDGGAWLAYNALGRDLFFRPEDAELRQISRLIRVSADGNKVGSIVALPRGDVLALATSSSDSDVLWVGTSSGLYRLGQGETELIPITAKGTLRASPVGELHVHQDTGVVWMSADAEGPDLSANLIGYNPAGDSVQNFTPDRDGLPAARRIDTIDFVSPNNLAVLAGGQLVAGQLTVPVSRFGLWFSATLVFGLLLGLAAVLSYGSLKRRRVEAGRLRPLLEAAGDFFALLGRKSQLLDFRTLLVPETGLAFAGPPGAGLPSSDEEPRKVPVRCTADDLVAVEEVQATFKVAEKAAGSNQIYSYLVYQRELDPAATRQLDVYRLRNNAIIVPLSRPFLVAKLTEGVDAARSALDGMKRRYLGEQDLFDVRNALDEPRFFFGRRALIDELCGVLSRGEHAALIGPRKSGKSSLLNLLQQRMNQFPIAKVDMQLYSRTEDENWPGKLFVRIVEAYDNWGRARHGANWKVPGNSVMDPHEFEAALRTRRELQRRFGSDLPLLVLIDEMERVFPRGNDDEVQRFIRASGTLRALGQEGGDKLLSLVVADRLPAFNRVNTFAVVGADTNPFYRFFKEFYLEPLQSEECGDMLREIGQAMGLELDDDVVQRVYQDSGGYVSLARQLASAACRYREGESCLNVSHYLAGMRWIREQSGEADVFFEENFWDQASAAERRVLYLASFEGGADAAELEHAGPVPILEGARILTPSQASRSELIDARRMSLATGMLMQQNHKFIVRGNLFREWLQQNIVLQQ